MLRRVERDQQGAAHRPHATAYVLGSSDPQKFSAAATLSPLHWPSFCSFSRRRG